MSYNADNVRVTVDGQEISPEDLSTQVPNLENKGILEITAEGVVGIEQVIVNGVSYDKAQGDV